MRSRLVSLAAVAWAVGACVSIADPNHCANNEGDQSCAGLLCSSCVAENNGCVAEISEEGCRVAGDGGGGTATSTTGATSGATEDTGPAPDCVGEGMVADCNESFPYCVGGTCSDCAGAGGSEYCAGVDAAKPVCHRGIAACVQCDENDGSACMGATFCDTSTFACGGCTEHAQCPVSACNLKTGECMDSRTVYWIDADVCPAEGFGQMNDPYCSVATALANPGDELVIHILESADDIPDPILSTNAQNQRTIAVLGEGDVALAGNPPISVASGSTVYASRVVLRGSPTDGIRCQSGSEVWLDDSRITDSAGDAISASTCQLRIRRSEIVGNPGGGLVIVGASDLRLWSSIVGGNGDVAADTRGVWITDSTFDVRYSTVANNTGMMMPGTDSLLCATSAGVVRNSILLDDAPSVDCGGATFTGSYSDTDLGDENVVGPYNPQLFDGAEVDNYRLQSTATDLMSLAQWDLGDPRYDVDGTLRGGTPGGADWTGADVP